MILTQHHLNTQSNTNQNNQHQNQNHKIPIIKNKPIDHLIFNINIFIKNNHNLHTPSTYNNIYNIIPQNNQKLNIITYCFI